MTEPSPAMLRAYADELRQLARAQENRSPAVADLLKRVIQLDTADTWTGQYAEDTGLTLAAWHKDIRATSRACVDDGARWRALANRLDTRADDAEAASKKAGTA